MESIIDFFQNIPPAYRSVIFIFFLVLFWFLEGTLPLFSFKYKRYRHAGINLLFTLMTFIIGFGFAWLLLEISIFTTENQFGLLYLVELPVWLHIILGVLFLDLIGAYTIHWMEHQVKWMWKFHLIHHSDRNVDVTTGLRHHPGETLFRITFTILGVFILGVPMGIIMLYQTLSIFFGQITHTNIKIPEKIDHLLSYVFVTPNMHKVHHHYTQPLTDTNYGNIFSIWDRLFGTFVYVKNTNSLIYGIDTHMDPRENESLNNLLVMPFQKYRPPKGSKFSDTDDQNKDQQVRNQ